MTWSARQDQRLTDALKRGNRDEFVIELERIRQEWTRSERDVAQAARDHANLFKSPVLARQLLAKMISDARGILDQLHDRGRFQTRPYRFWKRGSPKGMCICGELLSGEDGAAVRRRNHIKSLMDQARKPMRFRRSSRASTTVRKNSWPRCKGTDGLTSISRYSSGGQRANARLAQLGERQRDIEARIAALPDVDIRQLREVRDRYREER